MTTCTAFFGDGTKTFALPPHLIVELERKTNTGIGTLCLRIPEGHFRHAELVEVIRLALIGGGTSPEEAAALVETYAVNRPLAEPFTLASKILQAVWTGNAGEPHGQSDTETGAK
jgi:hypothetical protein